MNTALDISYSSLALVIGTAAVITVLLNIGYWFWRHRHNSKIRHTLESNLKLSANLEDERTKSNIIVNSIEDGVVLFNDKQTVLLFNPAAAAITGWETKEAIGLDAKTIFKFVDDKDESYKDADNPFVKVFESDDTIRDHQLTLMSRTNRRVALDLGITPLKDKLGQVSGAVAIFRDVSSERSEERRRAEFISTASHEMRTPVAAIEGYLALALNEKVSKVDASARAYIQKAHAATQHLGELFQDLLTSAKAEDGRLSNHPADMEAGEFLRRLGEELKFAADKKGLAVRLSIGAPQGQGGGSLKKVIPPLYFVHADPDRLREVVTNLFDNAVKYTAEGTITLGVTGNEDVVQLRVADTGAGIPAEDVPHLFQKFYRVDNSATRTVGGTGLGLFICRKIVGLYGGRIWVESKEGEGSTFYINLPRIKPVQAAVTATPAKPERSIPVSTPVAASVNT